MATIQPRKLYHNRRKYRLLFPSTSPSLNMFKSYKYNGDSTCPMRQKAVYIPPTLSSHIFISSLFCLKEISHPLSTMKSRIIHVGWEVLMETTMNNTALCSVTLSNLKTPQRLRYIATIFKKAAP
jgi:hypothetical protein